MLRHLIKGRNVPYLSFLSFPFLKSDNAEDSPTGQKILVEDASQSGLNRLKLMFTVDEFSTLSPELNSVLQVGFFSSFFGGLYGGVNASKIAYLDFIDNNKVTAFKDHLDAKKKLQDAVTISFGKGFFKWGWRLGWFCTSYMLVTTTVSVYRGKSSILEYIAGGAVAGSMYKFFLGPRAMLVGGILGGALGTAAGAMSLILMNISGMNMEDVRYWQYKLHSDRQEKFGEAIKKYKEKDDTELLILHSKTHDHLKHGLDNIEDVKQ